jgi:hypothetical protein
MKDRGNKRDIEKEKEVDLLTLARFANLRDEGVDQFRHSTGKGFLPDFWSAQALGHLDRRLAWKETQKILRDAWRQQFPPKDSLALILSVAFYSQWAEIDAVMPPHIRELPNSNEGGESVASDLVGLSTLPLERSEVERVKVWPFQSAVMCMGTDRWRARFCPTCGDLVAAMTKRGNRCERADCYEEARKASKRESWRRNGKRWRVRAKASVKGNSKEQGKQRKPR